MRWGTAQVREGTEPGEGKHRDGMEWEAARADLDITGAAKDEAGNARCGEDTRYFAGKRNGGRGMT